MQSLSRTETRQLIGIVVQIFLALLFTTSLATAAVPGRVAYQGLLLDSNGVPVTDSVDIDVAIYDAASGGTNLWSESHLGVNVLDGVYSIELGATTPLSGAVLQSGNVFLEITIDAETLTPRQQLLAVPYALKALEADNLSGMSGEYFVQMLQDVSFDGGNPPNLDPSERRMERR